MPQILIKKQKVVIENQTVNVTELQYVGLKIKEFREERGWTQQTLADKMELARASIANMETARHSLDIRTLQKFCEVFECKSSDLLSF